MGDDDLLNFIIKSRERGRQDDQIVQQLLSVGWRKEKIEGAYIRLREIRQNEKRGAPAPQQPQTQAQPQEGGGQTASPPSGETPLRQQSVIPSLQASPANESPAQSPQGQPIDLAKKKGISLPALGIFGKKQQPQPALPQQAASPQAAQQPQPPPQQAAPSLQPGDPREEEHAPRSFPNLGEPADAQKKGIFQNRLVMYTLIIIFGVILAAVIYYAALAPMMAGGAQEARPSSRAQKPAAAPGNESGMKIPLQNAPLPPEQAQAEFRRIMGLQANLTYTAEYAATFGGAQIPTTMYAKTSAKKRTDTSLFGESRSYELSGKSYSCSRQNGGWVCTDTTPNAPSPSEANSMESTPSLYRAAWNGTVQIANATATCFLVADQSNQTSRYCYSPEGLTLLGETIPSPGKSPPSIGMTAKRYTLSADDSLFVLPAVPRPLFQPKNASAPAASPPAQAANATPPSRQAAAPAQNSTAAPAQIAGAPAPAQQNFTRTAKYAITFPYNASKFCWSVGGQFSRAHFRLYWGGGCTSEKGTDGFDPPSEFSAHCSESPCCHDGPMQEYSKKYDYIECGFY